MLFTAGYFNLEYEIDAEDPLVPLWISQGILIVGFILFSIRLLELLWAIVIGKETGFRHKDEAEESMQLAEQLAADKEPDK